MESSAKTMLKRWTWFSVPVRLFEPKPDQRSSGDILLWWESRRLPYNWLVFRHAVCSLPLFFVFISLSGELKPGDDAVEPMALIFAPFAVNLLYTLGWVLEGMLSSAGWKTSKQPEVTLMRLGVYVSLAAIWAPTALWALACLITLAHGLFA